MTPEEIIDEAVSALEECLDAEEPYIRQMARGAIKRIRTLVEQAKERGDL